MNEIEIFLLAGLTEEEVKALEEAAAIMEEQTRTAIVNAVTAISAGFSKGGIPALSAIIDKLWKELEEIGKEPCARRQKMERSRAKAIEQRYRAEIRRAERERFYRRIYKPP